MAELLENVFNRISADLASSSTEKSVKIEFDKKSGIIRILGPDCTALSLASSSITHALEIAYSSAEHHPYWAMLYHSAEICKSVLEGWDQRLTRDQLEEIDWRCNEIKGATERLHQPDEIE